MFEHVSPDARRAVVYAAELAWLEGDGNISPATFAQAVHAVISYRLTGDLGPLPLLAEEKSPAQRRATLMVWRDPVGFSEPVMDGLRLAELYAAKRECGFVDLEDWASALSDYPEFESVIERLAI